MIDIEALWWVPVAAVLAMTVLGLLAARAQPSGPARRFWVLGILIVGIASVALTAWQAVSGHAALSREAARLAEIGSRLDQLGKLLPDAPGGNIGGNPTATFDTVTDAIRSLNARIEDLQEQVRVARETYRNRRIEPETASRLAAHLRGVGPHRVVVSSVPGDAEAFTYASQLVNILRDAGWDALGPETTTIFGAPSYPGVTLFAPSGGGTSKAVTALIEGFTRFNIPHRSGIAPREAIPDPGTASLFVSGKS
ncbi:MAG: hypothetical protein AB7H90_04665 [Alphaproteobacteria bacterium]